MKLTIAIGLELYMLSIKSFFNYIFTPFVACSLPEPDLSIDLGSRFLVPNTQLNKLNISESHSEITGSTLAAKIKALPNVNNIYIYSCRNLVGMNFNNLDPLAQLKLINARDSNIPGTALAAIFKAALNINAICISHCKSLSDMSLNNLGPLNQLELIDVTGSNISGAALIAIIKAAPNLKQVNAIGCKNLTVIDKIKLNKFRASNPQIQMFVNVQDLNVQDLNVQGLNLNVPPVVTEDMLNNDHFITHFDALLLLNISPTVTTKAMYNVLARYTPLPNDLIMMLDAFIPNVINYEINTLKDLLPNRIDLISKFENSHECKNITLKYNVNLKKTVENERTDVNHIKTLLKYYKQHNKYTKNFSCYNNKTPLEPANNPFQLIVYRPKAVM